MGLDMYLTRKKFIGAQYEHRNVRGTIYITVEGKEVPIDFNRLSYVEESGIYWRKANAVHQWFVNNVQKGTDDCGDYYVSHEKLEELLKLCKAVKKDHDKAEELLPTQSGFFFGSTEYDEWYFQDIDYTVKELDRLLKDEKQLNDAGVFSEFYYHSSW